MGCGEGVRGKGCAVEARGWADSPTEEIGARLAAWPGGVERERCEVGGSGGLCLEESWVAWGGLK